MKIKVLLVDDHEMIKEGLKKILEIDDDILVIDMASNGDECLEKLQNGNIDVVLLDVNMPIKNGIETLSNIKENKIDCKVIMLTIHNETDYLMRAMDLGANGYVLKEASSEELIYAIKEVMDNKIYIQSDLLPLFNSKMLIKTNEKSKVDTLTKRELDVLILVAEGLINKEIAENLLISERTVKNHIFNIFKKINVTDRTQAAIFAIRNNIVKIF